MTDIDYTTQICTCGHPRTMHAGYEDEQPGECRGPCPHGVTSTKENETCMCNAFNEAPAPAAAKPRVVVSEEEPNPVSKESN